MEDNKRLIDLTAADLDSRIERVLLRVLSQKPSLADARRSEATRPDKDWMTNREARAFLGVSVPTLQRYRASGRLRYSKVGSRVYYCRADLVAMLEGNRVTR